jgi:phospholipid transport system substrate-binding protein
MSRRTDSSDGNSTRRGSARQLMRAVAGAGLLLALALPGPSVARAEPASGAAGDTVRAFYSELLGTMRNAAALGIRGRYHKLAPVVQHMFDLPFMTKLSIGPAWDRLTAEQQQRAVSAFGRYITAIYASRFDGYSGEQFPVLAELTNAHGVLVHTQIIKSDGEAVSIDYMTHDNDTAWQIRDIYLGGSISELATRRSEFAAILRTAGIDGLIATLNRKADELES